MLGTKGEFRLHPVFDEDGHQKHWDDETKNQEEEPGRSPGEQFGTLADSRLAALHADVRQFSLLGLVSAEFHARHARS
jgi:hypothetical protein